MRTFNFHPNFIKTILVFTGQFFNQGPTLILTLSSTSPWVLRWLQNQEPVTNPVCFFLSVKIRNDITFFRYYVFFQHYLFV